MGDWRGVEHIVSGGQTGADRGGLDAAVALGIPHGGWCPKGRRAEDGTVPAVYTLRETPSPSYADRTRRNVAAGDGTLIIARGPLGGGTRLTATCARALGKPLLVIDRDAVDRTPCDAARQFRAWLRTHRIRTLNVAGPRESNEPGLQAAVTAFLCTALGPASDTDRDLPAVAEPRASYAAGPAVPRRGGQGQ